uniref:ADAMTS cysteine-rich domain-containing protein n=1 Tax=Romanomermis culicivorax TaxID=13658 RepID=A0A915JJ02_ROMCU
MVGSPSNSSSTANKFAIESKSDKERDYNKASNNDRRTTLKVIKREHDQVHRLENRNDNIAIICVLFCCLLIGLLIAAIVFDKQEGSKPSRKIHLPINAVILNDTKEKESQQPTEEEISLYDKLVPNLTSYCTSKYGPCFYHKNFYVRSCATTDCSSVMTIVQSNDFWFWQSAKKTIKTPNYALCSRGKWCLNGKCVSFPKKSSKFPKEPAPHGGGMRLECDETKACVASYFQSTNLTEFVKCPPKSTKSQCSDDDQFSGFYSESIHQNKLRTAFSPLRAPYVLYEICALCSNETDSTQCMSPTTADSFGKRCRNSDKVATFCVGHGNCVPTWKSAPDAYNVGGVDKTCPD